MILSFAKTTPALLAGAKTVTRRDWKREHAEKFRAGMLVDAWNGSPRQTNTHGTRKVATIRITRDPYLEDSREWNTKHYSREGFSWLTDHGDAELVLAIRDDWRSRPRQLYVVEFEVVEVLP